MTDCTRAHALFPHLLAAKLAFSHFALQTSKRVFSTKIFLFLFSELHGCAFCGLRRLRKKIPLGNGHMFNSLKILIMNLENYKAYQMVAAANANDGKFIFVCQALPEGIRACKAKVAEANEYYGDGKYQLTFFTAWMKKRTIEVVG